MTTDCDKRCMEDFFKCLKLMVNDIKEFNSEFMKFIESQKKQSKDLLIMVIRYNVLNNAAPCLYPIIEKEEIMIELMVKIQEKYSKIEDSLSTMTSKFNNLPQLQKILQKKSLELNWNLTTNSSIKGTIKHKAPSEYLENIADIIFQYDIAITCMQQYFDVLDLRVSNSYENLMNSFVISDEVVQNVDEFLLNSSSLS